MAFRSRRSGSDVLTTRKTRDVFEAVAVYAAPREPVWSVIWDPRTAQQIWPETLHSVVLPGTGPGVGEIHVQVERNASGDLSLSGVIVEECHPYEFVRYRGLDASVLQSVTEHRYTAIDTWHTEVRWVTTIHWPAGVPNAAIERTAEYERAFVTTYLRGSGRILGAPIELDGCWRRT